MMITQKDLKSTEIVTYKIGLCTQKFSLERTDMNSNPPCSSRTNSSTSGKASPDYDKTELIQVSLGS